MGIRVKESLKSEQTTGFVDASSSVLSLWGRESTLVPQMSCASAFGLTSAQGSPWWPGNPWTQHNAGTSLVIRNERPWARKYAVSDRWGLSLGFATLWVFVIHCVQKNRDISVVLFLPHELHRSTGLSYLINLEDESTVEIWKYWGSELGEGSIFCSSLFSFLSAEPHQAMWLLLLGMMDDFIPNKLGKGVLLLPWEFSCFAHSFRQVAGQLWIKMKPEICSWK